MTRSRLRSASRPHVEKLESRLQPGSMITGPGYGWSLLADNLSILNQGSVDSQGQLSPSSSLSSPLPSASSLGDLDLDALNTAVASLPTAQSTSLPISKLTDNNLSTSLTNDDWFRATTSNHANALLSAASLTASIQQPPPA